jgi:hypothetical protein
MMDERKSGGTVWRRPKRKAGKRESENWRILNRKERIERREMNGDIFAAKRLKKRKDGNDI